MNSSATAVGIIESAELLPLLEAGNAMKKAADVSLRVIRPLGGGILVGIISGELGAVRVAFDTASSAISAGDMRTGIFSRPSQEVWELLEQTADLEPQRREE